MIDKKFAVMGALLVTLSLTGSSCFGGDDKSDKMNNDSQVQESMEKEQMNDSAENTDQMQKTEMALQVEDGTYEVNTSTSKVNWEGYKLASSHVGFVNLTEGMVEIQNNNLVSGSFTLDMTSLESTDAPGVTGHLKNDDFFSVDAHPTATFELTSSTKQENGMFLVKGDMTIKGITKQIEFPVTLSSENNQIMAEADISIDRTSYDIVFRSGSVFSDLGDSLIKDNFDIRLKLYASQK